MKKSYDEKASFYEIDNRNEKKILGLGILSDDYFELKNNKIIWAEKKRRGIFRMALLFCCFRYPAKLGVQIAGTMFQTHAIFFSSMHKKRL